MNDAVLNFVRFDFRLLDIERIVSHMNVFFKVCLQCEWSCMIVILMHLSMFSPIGKWDWGDYPRELRQF